MVEYIDITQLLSVQCRYCAEKAAYAKVEHVKTETGAEKSALRVLAVLCPVHYREDKC